MENKKALIADNSYHEFEILNDLLTNRGFEVQWVKNGPDAVDQFPSIKPDLLILDALLPGLTGIKVCQQVRNLPEGQDVKTIILSSVYKQFKDKYDSRKMIGVDAYAEKPVDVASFERLILELMGEEIQEQIETKPLTEGRKSVGPTGVLEVTPFPKILFFLKKFKRTGALGVVNEKINKYIYVQAGQIYFVSSNQSSESLGRYMVQSEMLTVTQYNASLEKMLESGQQQGRVLLDMGVVNPHQLYEALTGHMLEKVLSVFAWETGSFSFRSGKLKLDNTLTVKIDLLDVIKEGLLRSYPLARLEGFFNEYKNHILLRMKKSLYEKGELILKPTEAKFLRLIDGKPTLGQVVAQTRLSLTETFQLLYYLILVEEVRFVGDVGLSDRSIKTQEEFLEGRRSKRQHLRDSAFNLDSSGGDQRSLYKSAVERMFELINAINHFELLQLGSDASQAELKHAYYRLVQKYHPSELYTESDTITRAKADGIFSSLTEAYEVLTDKKKREQYLAALKTAPPQTAAAAKPKQAVPAKPKEVSPLIDETFDFGEESVAEELMFDAIDPEISWDAADQFAETDGESGELEFSPEDMQVEQGRQVTQDMAAAVRSELEFQKGEDLIGQKKFKQAAENIQKAIELNPNEAEYHAYLGWVRFLHKPKDQDNIHSSLETIQYSLSINPHLDVAYYFFGMIAYFGGDGEKAKNNFGKALQFNPLNEKARQALEKLES